VLPPLKPAMKRPRAAIAVRASAATKTAAARAAVAASGNISIFTAALHLASGILFWLRPVGLALRAAGLLSERWLRQQS